MSAINRNKPVIESGLCRCCGLIKRCRILNVEYHWAGQKEVYSDMFVDCFGLLLSHLDGEDLEKAICATCVTRLREAVAFRKQVLSCEEKLLLTKIHVSEDAQPEAKVKVEIDEVTGDDIKHDILSDDKHDIQDDKRDIIDDDHNYDDICNDELDDDDDICLASLKTDVKQETVPAPKRKLLKTSKLKGKDLVSKKYLKMKKLLQRKLKKEKRKIDNELHDSISYIPIKENRPKIKDTDQENYLNTVTIVENSYVCPFYTSFSDYYCIYCRNTFIDPEKLREHTLQHDQTTFRDIFDNKKFAQIDILKIDCRLCPIQINSIESLKEHLQKVHGKLIYEATNEFLKFKLTSNNLTCIECNASNFKFFHALKKHMAEHFGSCICDICGAHYFEERGLLLHQKTHQKTVDETYPCKDCGKTFKSRHNRNLHEAKVHKKEAAYPCNKCDDIFFSYTLRYRHMMEVHGEERTFQCEYCDRVYDSRKSLREHNRRSHLKIMKHQCDLCDRRFYLPSRLKEHMSTHTGERNYRCEYCGKSYPRLRGLKVHMQTHSADKKFRCVLCNASFTQNVNLKNHMKRQHQSIDIDESFHPV